MEHHDCEKPTEWPVDGPREWTCPECGDRWRVEPLGPTDPALSYQFFEEGGGQHETHAVWVRIGEP